MIKNKLLLNRTKTAAVIFKSNNIDTEITLDNTFIKYPNSVRLLGLINDPSLDYSSHIDTLMGKVTNACFGLKSSSRESSALILRTLYFTTIIHN